MFFHSEYSLIAPSANLAEEILYAKVQCPTIVKHRYANGSWIFYGSLPQIKD